MTDRDRAAATLRHRLAELLASWDTELAEDAPEPDSSAGRSQRRRHDPRTNALKEKERLIAELENRVNRYAEAIIDLKHSEDTWKRKYLNLAAAEVDPDATATELQLLDEDEALEKDGPLIRGAS